jgi:hypothetical protein
MSIVVVYRLYWGRCVLRDGGVYRGARYVVGATGSGQLVMWFAPQHLGSEQYDVRWMAIKMVMGVRSVDLR